MLGQMTLRDDTRQHIQQVIDTLVEVSGANSSNIFNATSKLLDSNDNKVKMGAMKFLELFSSVADKQNLSTASKCTMITNMRDNNRRFRCQANLKEDLDVR